MGYLLFFCCESMSCVSFFCDFMDCTPPGSFVYGISQQEYWSGLPFPSPGSLSDPGIEPTYPACRWILYHWAIREAPNGTLHSSSFPGGASSSEQRGCPSGLWTGDRKGQMKGQGSCAVQRWGGGGSRGGGRKCTVSWTGLSPLALDFLPLLHPASVAAVPLAHPWSDYFVCWMWLFCVALCAAPPLSSPRCVHPHWDVCPLPLPR